MKRLTLLALALTAFAACGQHDTYYGENGEPCLDTGTVQLLLPSGAPIETSACLCTDSLILMEGDIVLPEDAALPPLRGTITIGRLWADGVVPYQLSAELPNRIKTNIQEAIAHWQEKTKIRFVPYDSKRDADYIVFIKHASATTGASNVGNYHGKQYIRLGSQTSRAVAIHEIGHSLGLFHEQSRPDRDQYVTIKWDNIRVKHQGNFKIKGEAVGPYDFHSRMHYPPTTFARNRNKPTIVPKDPANQIENDGWLSPGDIQAVNTLYHF
ncbi:peptidase [Chitinophaga agrisoli]|uniref:Peptidase n=1 Tax=Chitinophaga agrisoli TaxID=2607653 RepID=A0A5B2VKF3_9BACT|nr:M12 family metallopeptidase [Chitinophaga agrisoli]KAA2238772.1 peptidase [Chitinophaga agrisoli]